MALFTKNFVKQNNFSNIINIYRKISTTKVVQGKRNVTKFPLFHFRWTKDFAKRQETNPDPHIIVYDFGVRQPVYKLHGKTYFVPERVPELIVPDLTDCPLKPYVSYKTLEVVQGEFTAKDLFAAIYTGKIEEDYRNGKLDENGQPLEPNEAEKMTPEEARRLARKTGSDIFQ